MARGTGAAGKSATTASLDSGTLWFFPIDTVTDLAWMIIVENFHITVNGG